MAFSAPAETSEWRRMTASAIKKVYLHNSVFHFLLILLIGFIAYSNSFSVPFHFDDVRNIVENHQIKDLGNFWPPIGSRWFGYLTFALNYRFHGLDVRGYHTVNLAIHVINALLVYFLIVLTFKTPYYAQSPLKDRSTVIALFSGLLFAAHPVQTQAVTYIVQRFASLATMFYLVSLVFYIQWRIVSLPGQGRERHERLSTYASRLESSFWYLASLFSTVLAMKTKEIAFTLPLVVVLYEFMFFKGTIKKRLLWLIPLLLTLLIIPLSLISLDKPIGDIIGDVGGATRLQSTLSRWDYLFTQFRVIVTYIRLIFLPINQNLDYDYPAYYSFFEPAVFLAFLFLSSLLALSVYLVYRSRFMPSAFRFTAFGIFWFFITLTVESSVIPIADIIYEHRLYLPSIGAFIAITSSLFIVISKPKRQWLGVEKAILSIFVLMLATFLGATYSRNIVWQNEISLWSDVVKKSQGKVRGYINLGQAYQHKELFLPAIEMYNKSLQINSNLFFAYNNLGIIYEKLALYDEALKNFMIAITIRPNSAEPYNNAGIIYAKFGKYDRAIENYSKAITINPTFVEAYTNRGNAYDEKGHPDKAIEEYNNAIALDPTYANAYLNRGYAYVGINKSYNAFLDFQKACRLGDQKGCEESKIFQKK